jgi:phosphoribosylaminoimidazolecarboxamide formyltransferase/IMP cyclohydrolase
VRVFEHTAAYDGAIANYFGARLAGEPEHFGRTLNLQLHKVQDLRYGENPHQRAAFYAEAGAAADDLAMARQLQGKALSYNNIADTDAALECVKQFARSRPASSSSTPTPAAWPGRHPLAPTSAPSPPTRSPPSAASSPSTVNSTPTPPQAIVERQFVEVIVAPAVSEAACEAVAAKKNVRVLVTGDWTSERHGHDTSSASTAACWYRTGPGRWSAPGAPHVSRANRRREKLRDLLFAWNVAKFVKSNAIVYAPRRQTIGVGAGQMSRVNSARIAAIKAEHAGLEVRGAVMASDAFFPFRDGIDNAGRRGASRGHPARRLDARRGGHRRRRRARHGDGVHRHAPLPPLSRAARR